MRLLTLCAALLLLIGASSCSGGALKSSDNHDTSKVFTLSDADINAFVASPDLDWHNDIATGGRLAVPPAIFADVASSDGGATKGVSSYGRGHDGCGKCSFLCGKCNHKHSCKCHGECKKCHSCNDGCKKCSHTNTCTCHGKCKQKCGHCKSGCKKCTHDGNCGCCKCDCTPPPCDCKVVCKKIEYKGARTFSTDCTTHKATIIYSVHVTYNDCPNRDDEALGHTVTFYRNGAVVGTGTTDINGDATFTETAVGVGSYSAKAVTDCCSVCYTVCVIEDCCEVECLSMENTGGATFKADCQTHCADVAYSVHIAYTDCPDRTDEALGHDVVFSRNGAEVGHGTTDANGDASFTEQCVDLGDYDITVVSDDCNVEFPVNVYEDCCVEMCTGMDNDTQRFFLADCFGAAGEADLNVHLNFNECPGHVFDKSGMDVHFSGDGTDLGTVKTDADGDASFAWANVPIGNHHVTAVSDNCATEFDITVWDECAYHACIAGKGKLPGVNGSPYFVFQYEGHVRNGVLEMNNTMSGNDGTVNFVNTPVEWVVVLGLEVYFGNDNIMFHTIDNGKAPGVDFAEVWVFDQNYHNAGLLVNGQIRSSWGLDHP